MSLTLYSGPNFSGRSGRLKEFAWALSNKHDFGQYLAPLIDVNFSGLARLVGGEAHLHKLGLPCNRTSDRNLALDLVAKIPYGQHLTSLSGGEAVRVLLACALASKPARLAIDGLLEQLDAESRRKILSEVLVPLGRTTEVHISDNEPKALEASVDHVIPFERPAGAPDINRFLQAFSRNLAQSRVRAPELRLEKVSFSYPGSKTNVFTAADFTFYPGRPYLLKAPNGAGKSTLARLLVGVLAPQKGRFLVDGKTFWPSRSSTNLMFYAFQNPLDQIFGTSAVKYLSRLARIAAKRNSLQRSEFFPSLDAIMGGFGISHFADFEPFDLPFVVAKRLSLAAAIVSRAPWFFFDEPALGSDSVGRLGLRQLVNSLCKAGIGILIVTHGQEFDGLPGQTTVTIREGTIIEEG